MSDSNRAPRRHRPVITISNLLMLVLVFAVLTAWWKDRGRLLKENQRLEDIIASRMNTVKVFYLRNVAAEDLAKTLRELVGDSNSNNTIKIVTEPRTNSLIVSAPEADARLLEALIRRLDEK